MQQNQLTETITLCALDIVRTKHLLSIASSKFEWPKEIHTNKINERKAKKRNYRIVEGSTEVL